MCKSYFFFLKYDFCLEWDYGNCFSVMLFKWDLFFFFYSMRRFFTFLFSGFFSRLMLRKLGKEKKKNLIRVGFFLSCFIQGNETKYSSMLFLWKIENFCFTMGCAWECCWTSVSVKRNGRNFLIFVYFVVCLIIFYWFYAFRNAMSTFLFFCMFIYF